ncbi:MAG: hypothetical protein QXJ68_02600 [Methanocellales archaeon]
MLNKFIDEAIAEAMKKSKNTEEILLALGERALFVSLYTKILRLKNSVWNACEEVKNEELKELLRDIVSDELLWLYFREKDLLKKGKKPEIPGEKEKGEDGNWIKIGKLSWCEQNGVVNIKYGQCGKRISAREIEELFNKYDPITIDDLLKDLKSKNLATMMLKFFQHHPKYKDKVVLKEGKWRKKYLYKSDPASRLYKIFCMKHPDFEIHPEKMCTYEAVFNNEKPCPLKQKFLKIGARVECSPPKIEQTNEQIVESNGKIIEVI